MQICNFSKRSITIAIAGLLAAAPASAATWVTVATIPYRRGSKQMVGYQIDAESRRVINGDVYAKGRWSYPNPERDVELLRAQCSRKRLMQGADRVSPPAVWIKQVGRNWVWDSKSIIKGDVAFKPYEPTGLWLLKTRAFEFLCDKGDN